MVNNRRLRGSAEAGIRASLAVLLLAAAANTASAQPCVREWTSVGDGATNGVSGQLLSMAVIEGSLYAGGVFDQAGGVTVNRLGRWDGQNWSGVGSGFSHDALPGFPWGVYAVTAHGGNIYAAGDFSAADGFSAADIAVWNGSGWSEVGGGLHGDTGSRANALAIYDNQVYVGGSFLDAGFAPQTRGIARWNAGDQFWDSVGGGIASTSTAEVSWMTVHNGALYVGGSFESVGGAVMPDRLAKWDGLAWTPVTIAGLGDPSTVRVKQFYSLNGGLYCTLRYTSPAVARVAQWNGTSWTLLAGEFTSPFVNALSVDLGYFDDGTGPALYAGGNFRLIDGAAVAGAAKWNGVSWSSLGSGVNGGSNAISAGLTVFDGGLYFSGSFSAAGGVPATSLARWGCNPQGACCMPSGACETRTRSDCGVLQSGQYGGDNIDCASIPACVPAATGACCLASGCQILWQNGATGCVALEGAYRGDNSVCASAGCPTWEVEPNNLKGQATPALLNSGVGLAGVSLDSASPDYWVVQTENLPLRIYQHRLVLTSATAGHFAGLRGLNQTAVAAAAWPCSVGSASAGSDSSGQGRFLDGTSSVNIWYGFGKQEQVYYRVNGSGGLTAPYFATLQTTEVTPVDLGNLRAGVITISTADQGHTSDTHLVIFDDDFSPIPGYSNDGASTNGGALENNNTPSHLQRQYAAGTYYLAMSLRAVATSIGSPCDDNRRNNTLMDFPNAVMTTNVGTTTDVSFSITDTNGMTVVSAARGGPGEIAWFKFTAAAVCVADFNNSGGVSVQDIFDFLIAYFSTDPRADVNQSGGVTVQDIFDFLTAYFTPCP